MYLSGYSLLVASLVNDVVKQLSEPLHYNLSRLILYVCCHVSILSLWYNEGFEGYQ